MKRLFAGAALALVLTPCVSFGAPGPAAPQGANVVSACGAQNWLVNTLQAVAMDPTGVVCTKAGGSTGNPGAAPTDSSGTVAVGGTFQQVFAANSSRTTCLIANPITATETLFVHYTAASATTANSLGLAPGAAFTCNGSGVVLTGAISVTAATSTHAFVATGS